MSLNLLRKWCAAGTLGGLLLALGALAVGQGAARAADIPPIGAILTNSVRQVDGTLVTKRYRVTTGVTQRTAQVDSIDPRDPDGERRLFPAAVNADILSTGTGIEDLPSQVLVIRQKAVLELFGPSSRADGIPTAIDAFYFQTCPETEFVARGPRSSSELERGIRVAQIPLSDSALNVTRRFDDLYDINVDLLKARLVDAAGITHSEPYWIVPGAALAVSVSTHADNNTYGGRVVASLLSASPQARGGMAGFAGDISEHHPTYPTPPLLHNVAVGAEFVGVEELAETNVPQKGTILTNSVRQADGSTLTKRYRVTTELLRRDAQVGALDPQKRKFASQVDEFNSGTHIVDLPPLVVVARQKGVLRVYGPSERADGWPTGIKHIHPQTCSYSDFLIYGSKSFIPPGTTGFFSVAVPIDHPAVKVARRADDFYDVSVDYLSSSGSITELPINGGPPGGQGQYVVVAGGDVVVSGSIDGEPGSSGGQVLGSSLPHSGSAHGLTYTDELRGGVELNPRDLLNPMYNVCWGAEFVGVEELAESNVPPIGTILTNSVRQADGSTLTKRYRVTTELLRRDAQVGRIDPEHRKFTASVNAGGTGTYITDLPPKVLVIAQKGVLRVFGTSDPNRDGWPSQLTHVYSQVSSLSEFIQFGPKSFVPPETHSFQMVPAPITHPGVQITRNYDLSAEDFYSVRIDYLSGIVAETAERWGQYIITDGTNVVVAGSIPGSAGGFGGQVLGSSLPASASAHGVIEDDEWPGFVEFVGPYLARPMFNACWGAEFVGVEELAESNVPPIGTILTNSVRQADGSTLTKRYRVTTELLRRDAQVGALDPEKRKFAASVDAYGSGTFISDLPEKVLVVAQKGVLRVFGAPDPNRTDGWPAPLTHIYSQVSSLSEFIEFGSKSFVPPETHTFQMVPAPITHPGVHITRNYDLNAEDFYSVRIDYLSGIVAETAERWGHYIITDGTNVVVSGSIPGFVGGFGGQVVGSSMPASESAHGVTLSPNYVGRVEFHPVYSANPMYNVCWGAEFVGVEELTDTVPTVTLTGRMVGTGFQVSFAPVVPAASQLESSATLPGTWSPVQDVPAGAASAIVETTKLPSAPAFFRLSAKP